MSTKKFSLSDTPVKRLIDGKEYLLYRIIAEKSFDTFLAPVNKGEFGGLVSSEKTLSQESVCWIFPDAAVVEGAVVKNEAVIAGCAIVGDNAVIQDSAFITDNAIVTGSADIAGSSTIGGYAVVSGDAQVAGDSLVIDNAIITGRSVVSNLWVKDNTLIEIPCSIDYIEAPPEAPITVSGDSSIRHAGQPLNNVFNRKQYSFEIKDAVLDKPEDCCIIPLRFCNDREFFVKYKSSSGIMVYNSINKKTLTVEEFKRESLRLFESYKTEKPVTAKAIEPFIEQLRDYDPKNPCVFKDLTKRFVDHLKADTPELAEVNKAKLIPLRCITNYLELHFLSLPWLLGSKSPGVSKEGIINLLEKIVEKGSLDIRLNKLVDFGDAVFLNNPLMDSVFNSCCKSETVDEATTTISLGKNVVFLAI